MQAGAGDGHWWGDRMTSMFCAAWPARTSGALIRQVGGGSQPGGRPAHLRPVGPWRADRCRRLDRDQDLVGHLDAGAV